jgi:hypothetical protein
MDNDGRETRTLKPDTLVASVNYDDGAPVLVIDDGDLTVKLPGGRDPEEAQAALRRIAEAIWNFQMSVNVAQLARCRDRYRNQTAAEARVGEPMHSEPGTWGISASGPGA